MRPDMELALAARAENIAIVRHALGGFGEAFDISEEKLSDIRLAVTEACANVVMHAYPDRGPEELARRSDAALRGWGMMEVCAALLDDELVVVVRDWGQGIRPRADSPGLGLGLSLMATLADTVQLGHDPQRCTEVRMTFVLSGERQADDSARGLAGAAIGSARIEPVRGLSNGRT